MIALSPSALLRALAAALLLSSCGGGVETGGTGSGSYVEGPVVGFGSVIIGGVRLDEGAARIEDSDGQPRDAASLRLGMRLEVDGGAIGDDSDGGRSAAASLVRIAPELLGPVTAMHGGSPFVDVMGQAVRLSASTLVDGVPGGAAGLAVGDIVEVHGFPEPQVGNDRYVATRIERRASTPPVLRVRGLVRNLDVVARTMRIGPQHYDLAATGVPAGLTNGQMVRLGVQSAPVAGRWPVLSIAIDARQLAARDEVELEGAITAVANATSFEVNGIVVDARGATFVDGSAGIVPGARVKLRGRAAGGTLVATSVDLRSDADAYNEGVDLRDTLSILNLGTQTFVLRGTTVFFGSVPPPLFVGGSVADLVDGRRVRVRAVVSADRTRVVATRIEFVSP